MREAEIRVSLGKNELMRALRAMTLDDYHFNPGPWSLWDAESLEHAAALIRREIEAASAAKPKGGLTP